MDFHGRPALDLQNRRDRIGFGMVGKSDQRYSSQEMVMFFVPAPHVLHSGLLAIFSNLAPSEKPQAYAPSAIVNDFLQRAVRRSFDANAVEFCAFAGRDLKVDLHILRASPDVS